MESSTQASIISGPVLWDQWRLNDALDDITSDPCPTLTLGRRRSNLWIFLMIFLVLGQWELQGINCYQFFDIRHSWEKASELCKRYVRKSHVTTESLFAPAGTAVTWSRWRASDRTTSPRSWPPSCWGEGRGRMPPIGLASGPRTIWRPTLWPRPPGLRSVSTMVSGL